MVDGVPTKLPSDPIGTQELVGGDPVGAHPARQLVGTPEALRAEKAPGGTLVIGGGDGDQPSGGLAVPDTSEAVDPRAATRILAAPTPRAKASCLKCYGRGIIGYADAPTPSGGVVKVPVRCKCVRVRR